MKNKRYFPKDIESKWQEVWKEKKIYESDLESSKNPFYLLVEFTYPSGNLHIGHWFAFSIPDMLARMKRMQGYDVFFPNGFDAFGLPAENAAIKRNIHPQDWTLDNIKRMKEQFGLIGASFDWKHEVITCLPEYYRWNQWIFLKMYERGLAYKGKVLSNWCPVDQTVLANEHVESGKCWRCGAQVVQKEVEQWFLKITDYADRLQWDKDGNGVEWPKSVMVAQNEWIGKKEGMKISHEVVGTNLKFKTFTAYPAWSWADTFIVIAPEHPLVKELVKETQYEKDVMDFVGKMVEKTELERKETVEKKGIFTGRYAKDPFGGSDMPIWLANFALMNFGTGIIRCSGHDQRDIDFAEKYKIKTKEVIDRQDPKTPINAHDNKGILKESGPFTGREVGEIKEEVMDWIEKNQIGTRFVNYHLHDWSISRQRYWGTPVPMINCESCGIVPVPEKDLPITLPYNVDYAPKGKAPLASNDEWLAVECPKCHGKATRDPETLDTFFDSSWYYYRYLSPHDEKEPFEKSKAEKFMPVNIYFGGGEHTLGHTLYARFFTKFFKDLGFVSFDEFALKRIQHGVILGSDGNRMSKSKGNVVNPEEQIRLYGSDAVRIYLAFLGPYDIVAPWNPGGMQGAYNFLKRVWSLSEKTSDNTLSNEDLRFMHKTIKKVGEDIENIKCNTAISCMMEWLNYLSAKQKVSNQEYETFLKLLAPFAPHMTEELWQEVGQGSIHQQSWPLFDKSLMENEEFIIAVQINGKTREMVEIKKQELGVKDDVEKIAKKSEKIQGYLQGKEIKKVIYVEGKIINFVIV